MALANYIYHSWLIIVVSVSKPQHYWDSRTLGHVDDVRVRVLGGINLCQEVYDIKID